MLSNRAIVRSVQYYGKFVRRQHDQTQHKWLSFEGLCDTAIIGCAGGAVGGATLGFGCGIYGVAFGNDGNVLTRICVVPALTFLSGGLAAIIAGFIGGTWPISVPAIAVGVLNNGSNRRE